MSDYTLEGLLKLRDQTGEATKAAAQGMESVEDQAKQTADALGGVDGANKQAATSFEDLEGTVKQVMAAFAVKKIIDTVHGLALLGAEVQRTEYAFQNISGGIAQADANLEAMREATRGAISDQDAMALSNRLLLMGLANNSEELGALTEMATRLGTAMGRDATGAVDEFTLLLANQSKLRLDTFGISVTNVDKRIEELKRTSRGLSDEQIFMQAVMDEGKKSMETLGPAIQDNQEIVDQTTASWENLKNEAAQAYSVFATFGKPLKEVFDLLTQLLKISNDLREEFGLLGANIALFTGQIPQTFWQQAATSIGPQTAQATQQPDWRTGRAADRTAGLATQNVTMYNPQFYGATDPQNMLDQLNRMGP